jgi:hypothetical protein
MGGWFRKSTEQKESSASNWLEEKRRRSNANRV